MFPRGSKLRREAAPARRASATKEDALDDHDGAPRTPDFCLLVAEEDGRVLTVGGDRAPAVFSGEGEAELFLRLAAGGGGRKIIRISPRELASLLYGPSCAGATRVALDPSPEMLADESLVGLVSVGKYRFLERFAKRDLPRGSEAPVAS